MSKRSNFRHIARRTTRARQATPRSLYRRPLRFEPLEDRRLLAVVMSRGIYAMVATKGAKAYTFIYGNYLTKREDCQ